MGGATAWKGACDGNLTPGGAGWHAHGNRCKAKFPRGGLRGFAFGAKSAMHVANRPDPAPCRAMALLPAFRKIDNPDRHSP